MNRHPRTGIPNLFHQACTFTHSRNEKAPQPTQHSFTVLKSQRSLQRDSSNSNVNADCMITAKALERPLKFRQYSPTGGPAFMLCFFSSLAFPKFSH